MWEQNFLSTLEFISQFYPFFIEHLETCGNKEEGKFSLKICDKVANLMGEDVQKHILTEVANSRCYSLTVDLTMDRTHLDQLSVCTEETI